MNEEAQQIAIAKACGYQAIKWSNEDCPNNAGYFGILEHNRKLAPKDKS